jgi:hypothetical protein
MEVTKYTVNTLALNSPVDLVDRLNELGAKGREIISVVINERCNLYEIISKRV